MAQKLSFQQIANLWIQQGGNPAWADTMAAIAVGGESGGNPTIKNKQSGAEGLFQILSSAQSPAFNAAHPPGAMSNPVANVKAAIALLGNGSGISNWSADSIGSTVVANGSKPLSPQQARQYASNPPIQATLDADVTKTSTTPPASTAPVGPGSLTVGGSAPAVGSVAAGGNLAGAQPSTTNSAPVAGADLAHFGATAGNPSGYDLTRIPQQELGNTESAITEYLKNPGLEAQIQKNMIENFGYQSWAVKVPQLQAVLIAASTQGWNENTFIGAVTATDWWKNTNQNQRAWQQMQGDDPSTAHELLTQSKEKALATANQLGVTLTQKQLNAIGNYIASGTATQSGVLGAVSGTLQEQIDQQIVYAATGQKQKGVNYATGLSSNGDLNVATVGGTQPNNLSGTSEYLYDQFKQIAQNYLMYSNSSSSPMNDQALMSHVESAMQSFTGSNSFGNSNLEQGAIANFTEQMQQQAAQLYPSMASAIKMGTTPQTYAQPIQNLIANTLGTNAQGIDLTDPKWNWTIAVPAGATAAPTQDQILQKLVTTPEYDQSNNGVSNAKSITSGLASMFGVGGQ